MNPHPHLEGLIRKWRDSAKSAANGPMYDGASEYAVAGTYIACADDLAQALAALPGGGVDGKPRLIGWRTDDYLMETADKAQAMNWECHHRILPIFSGDPHTKLPTPIPHEADRNG